MKNLFIAVLFAFWGIDAWAAPRIIAHRGGRLDWPENTLYAFKQARDLGVDIIELDVQVTKDGVPVLYHPKDLSEWTSASGRIADKTWDEIQGLEYKKPGFKISQLADVFEQIKDTPLILDMKSLPAQPLVDALIKSVPAKEWKRIIVYSTNKEHLDLLRRLKPEATLFEERAKTRGRLLTFIGSGQCLYPSDAAWLGFEFKRSMAVTEKLTLGDDSSEIEFHLWVPRSIDCIRKMAPKAKIALIGINSKEDYQKASELGVDAVYSDDPKALLSR